MSSRMWRLRVLALFLCCSASAALARPSASPKDLTEAEFRSLRDELNNPGNVDVASGYAQVRRQGRTNDGETFDFKRPLRVKNPLRFAAPSGRSLNFDRLERFDPGPVFDINEMLRKKAAKMKAKIQEASLKAAAVAERVEDKPEHLTEGTVRPTTEATVVHEAGTEESASTVTSGHSPVEEVTETVPEATERSGAEVADATTSAAPALGDDDEDGASPSTGPTSTEANVESHNGEAVTEPAKSEGATEPTTLSRDEPSSDIDLGSVLEV